MTLSHAAARRGSPPRMREILVERISSKSYTGITPAYAGNTDRRYQRVFISWDHPRVCGKYSVQRMQRHMIVGSPPRMREILEPVLKDGVMTRITPAYAGNTLLLVLSFRSLWDHPRVCGKYTYSIAQVHLQTGSPPRMREILFVVDLPLQALRITPAYAGNTKIRFILILRLWDHPRVCGKYYALRKACFRGGGSPPRMREIRDWAARRPQSPGITPAYAGNTKAVCDTPKRT